MHSHPTYLTYVSMLGPNEQASIAVTLYTSLSEVLGSNLGQYNGNPDLGFSWCSSDTSGKFRDGTSIRA
jgi:hypothetical protein